jgi:hypothetical protein
LTTLELQLAPKNASYILLKRSQALLDMGQLQEALQDVRKVMTLGETDGTIIESAKKMMATLTEKVNEQVQATNSPDSLLSVVCDSSMLLDSRMDAVRRLIAMASSDTSFCNRFTVKNYAVKKLFEAVKEMGKEIQLLSLVAQLTSLLCQNTTSDVESVKSLVNEENIDFWLAWTNKYHSASPSIVQMMGSVLRMNPVVIFVLRFTDGALQLLAKQSSLPLLSTIVKFVVDLLPSVGVCSELLKRDFIFDKLVYECFKDQQNALYSALLAKFWEVSGDKKDFALTSVTRRFVEIRLDSDNAIDHGFGMMLLSTTFQIRYYPYFYILCIYTLLLFASAISF